MLMMPHSTTCEWRKNKWKKFCCCYLMLLYLVCVKFFTFFDPSKKVFFIIARWKFTLRFFFILPIQLIYFSVILPYYINTHHPFWVLNSDSMFLKHFSDIYIFYFCCCFWCITGLTNIAFTSRSTFDFISFFYFFFFWWMLMLVEN